MRVSAFLVTALAIADRRQTNKNAKRRRREISSGHRRRRETTQAVYNFKLHPNASKHVNGEKGHLNPKSFLSFEKEDKMMMAQLSPIGGRRYMHLKKMVDYLFQNRNTTSPSLTQWWGYGCWCIAHGENPMLAKRGLPADPIDSVCKDHANCYECARMDYGHKCDPTQVGYEVVGNRDLVTGERFLTCSNSDDQTNEGICAHNLCLCDKMLAEGLVKTFDQWDEQYHISSSGFDGRASCELPEPIHDWGELDQCCGEYPTRAPYRSDNGNRQCCVDKTYHTYYLECCDGDVKTKGFCPSKNPTETTILATSDEGENEAPSETSSDQ